MKGERYEVETRVDRGRVDQRTRVMGCVEEYPPDATGEGYVKRYATLYIETHDRSTGQENAALLALTGREAIELATRLLRAGGVVLELTWDEVLDGLREAGEP